MQSKHVLTIVMGLVLVVPSAIGAAGDTVRTPADPGTDAAVPQTTLPDGRTMFNVGFDQLPDVGVGDTYQGAEILHVHEEYGFLTVATTSPDAFREIATADEDTWTVERDSPSAYKTMVTPDDPWAGGQWGIEGQAGADAFGAWENGFGTGQATVAVIDSGIDDTHPDLAGTQQPTQQGFCPIFGCVFGVPAQDTCPHGTHVAGTIAARTNNGIGIGGMSQANLIDLDALHQAGISCVGSFSSIAMAIDTATDMGADIISMSLGGPESAIVETAVRDAWNDGVLIVASAGNAGCSASTSSVGFPAGYGVVVAVSSVNPQGNLSDFSSCGPEVEIAAPGSSVLSTIPGASYALFSGTSMAAPHVSGAAALALSEDPSLTNQQLRDALNASADDTALPAREEGNGQLDACDLVGLVGGSVSCNDGLPYSVEKSYRAHAGGLILFRNHGGVVFPVVPDGSGTVELDIQDDSGDPVSALVQIRDGADNTIKQVPMCDSGSLDVPSGAAELLVFFTNTFSFAPCLPDAGVATTGSIQATFRS